MSCCRESRAARLAIELHRKGLTAESAALEAAWEDLPRGWTMESARKFWASLTGDRKHKVTACIKKMRGKVDDPGAFCGSLASKLGER